MDLPIVAPASLVIEHSAVFRDLFDNRCQVQHFPHDWTGLIILPNQSMAHSVRCIIESADNIYFSRVLSQVPWREEAVKRRRIRFMVQPTKPHRRRRRDLLVVTDDTLDESVESLLDHADRHDNHSDGMYPRAHHPVTSFSVSGPVRVPLSLRRDRRAEEPPPWTAVVAKPFPPLTIPNDTEARHRLHQQVDPVLLQEPECRAWYEQCRSTIARVMELIEEAIGRNVPFGVVVLDAWYLAEDGIQVLARRRQDWMSLLQKNRLLETGSCHRRDANSWTMQWPSPHIAIEAPVPLIQVHAYRPVTVSAQTYECFTLAARIPGGARSVVV